LRVRWFRLWVAVERSSSFQQPEFASKQWARQVHLLDTLLSTLRSHLK
jgi:hypothetical protein